MRVVTVPTQKSRTTLYMLNVSLITNKSVSKRAITMKFILVFTLVLSYILAKFQYRLISEPRIVHRTYLYVIKNTKIEVMLWIVKKNCLRINPYKITFVRNCITSAKNCKKDFVNSSLRWSDIIMLEEEWEKSRTPHIKTYSQYGK